MKQIPYLSSEGKLHYLVSHKMIDACTPLPISSEILQAINFHFLMGYARHYRNLVDNGYHHGPKSFQEIQQLAEAECDLAAFLTPWIRKAECHLRALTVKHCCSLQKHGEGYLDCSQWTSG